MNTPLNHSEENSREHLDESYWEIFREVQRVCERLVAERIRETDRHLKRIVALALDYRAPSEYPFLFLYSYAEAEQDTRRVSSLAAAVHLLQASTFVIDDIFDSSGARNRNETVVQKYGVRYAIAAGELLQSFAMEVISSELERGAFSNKLACAVTFNRIVRDVYLGQYLDMFNSSNPSVTIRNYHRVITLTTGSFLANVSKCGALLAGKQARDVFHLTRYGYYYGMAMQITDDIVDIIRPQDWTGKSFANDLRCRRMRLPLILALRLAGGEDAAFLKNFLAGRGLAETDVNHAAGLIEKCGAIGACRDAAQRYVEKSLGSLFPLTGSLTAERLTWLSERLFRVQELSGADS